jgi:hypothetical protein
MKTERKEITVETTINSPTKVTEIFEMENVIHNNSQ